MQTSRLPDKLTLLWQVSAEGNDVNGTGTEGIGFNTGGHRSQDCCIAGVKLCHCVMLSFYCQEATLAIAAA